MLLRYETSIGPDETVPELAGRLAVAGGPLVVETLQKVARGDILPIPQYASQATMAPSLQKQDGRIDWSLDAEKIYNRIRGLQPWPGAFTTFRGRNCQISGKPAPDLRTTAPPGTLQIESSSLLVTCGSGTTLQLEGVQIEGRKRVTTREFLNGARLVPQERFGT
jgi:methionyl-tRNA formyltransferase